MEKFNEIIDGTSKFSCTIYLSGVVSKETSEYFNVEKLKKISEELDKKEEA